MGCAAMAVRVFVEGGGRWVGGDTLVDVCDDIDGLWMS